MEDFGFNYPKKILRFVLVVALVVAVAWGMITGNSANGINLWKKEVDIITKPLLDRIERIFERYPGVDI